MNEIEREKLHHTWFPVAPAQDVVEGRLTPGRLLETRLVIFRSASGPVVAESNCPHRGADLALGQLVEGQVECPYHGWRFSSDGSCRCVPSLPADNLAPTKAKLKILNSLEKYGHVWASLEEPLLPFPHLSELEAGDWLLGAGTPRDVSCGLRQITENFRDISHFAFVHKRTMGPNVQRVVPPYEVRRNGFELNWTIPTEYGDAKIVSETVISDYHIILPSIAYVTSRFEAGRRFNGQFAAPIGDEQVRHFYLSGIDSEAAQSGISFEEYIELQRSIFAEDIPIVESQVPREAPLDIHQQQHTRADKFSIVYRRMYSEWLSTEGGMTDSATSETEHDKMSEIWSS